MRIKMCSAWSLNKKLVNDTHKGEIFGGDFAAPLVLCIVTKKEKNLKSNKLQCGCFKSLLMDSVMGHLTCNFR